MLETPRLLLRPLTQADGEAYARILADPEVTRYIGGPLDGAAAARQLEGIVDRFAADGLGPLAVERRDDGRLVGRVGFWIWDRRDWTGGHSARALGDDAVVELGLTRVVSLIDPRNEASVRVAERLGAVREHDVRTPRWGTLRCYLHRTGGETARARSEGSRLR